MKKVFSLLVLVLATVSTYAQSWQGKEPGETDFNSSTVVYARLTTNLNIEKPNFVIGAFIDGECRASVLPTATATSQLYTIRVWGDRSRDKGKTIPFKACDPVSDRGLEYTLGLTLQFNEEFTYGKPSEPLEFVLTSPMSYTLEVPELSVGFTYNLLDFLTVSPTGAIIPDNLVWTATIGAAHESASEYVSIDTEKGTMTALKPGEDISLGITAGTSGQLATPATFNIVQHAAAITLNVDAYRVNKGDAEALMAFLNDEKTFNVVPEGSNEREQVKWEVKDEDYTVIRKNEDGTFEPIAGGIAYMRPYIMVGETKIVPANNQWIAIEVYVPVTKIDIDTSIFGPVFKANVGDSKNLYNRLASMVRIQPDDATEKDFDFEYNGELLTKQGRTTFTAVKPGESSLKVVATAAPTVVGYIRFSIEQPATMWEGTPMLYTSLIEGKPVDITDMVKDNIHLNGTPYIAATITVTDKEGKTIGQGTYTSEGINLSTLTATKVTEYTVAIRLTWNDYDAWDGSTETCPTKTADFSFVVSVLANKDLAGFTVSYDTDVVAGGQNGTITFTAQPEGANFDFGALTVTPNTGLSEAWQSVFTWKEVSRDMQKLVFQYGSQVPLVFTVAITKDDKNYSIEGFDGVEIGYNLEMDKGWQWLANPWGNVTPTRILDVYSKDLVEIRTQSDLLFNDPDSEIGLFGTLLNTEGLAQDQCYKLMMDTLMAAPRSTGLHNPVSIGHGPKGAVSTTLAPGWNWVGNPYFFNRLIDGAMGGLKAEELEGMIVIGKNGSSEFYEGKWSPSFLLEAGQGYIVKNPTQKSITLNFPNEFLAMQPGDETLQANAAGVKGQTGVWQYDATRFMNNMTMVARLEGVDNPEQYTIGAFVGEECRGEGFLENGRLYVTVHCNNGEAVSFKLYNTLTGEAFSIRETLRAQMRVGSVREPMLLHAAGATGIDGVGQGATEVETYDLTGRRVAAGQRGITLRRLSDGSYRKAVVK